MGYIENEIYLNKSFQHIYQVSKTLSTPITGVSLEVLNDFYSDFIFRNDNFLANRLCFEYIH